MDEERAKLTESGMLFFDLLILLRELTRAQLGLIADPKSGEVVKNTEVARHLVDMIAVMQEKTKGNLTRQEEQVLENLLNELRMACVRAESSQSKPEEEGKTDDEEENN